MSDINTSCVSGRLTKDPEFFGNPDAPVARLSIASNRSYQRDGKWEDETLYVEISVFGNHAQSCKRLVKGNGVTVSGRLQLNRWKAQDGSNRERIRLVANAIDSPHFRTPRQTDEPTQDEQLAITAEQAAQDEAAEAEVGSLSS